MSKPPDSVRGGKMIAGKYRIESLLGTGAMGTVWVATHVTLGSKVAVKLVSTDFARSAETKSRFLAEAKAAAALRSRYVVQMFDSGVTEDGAPYIVMEYLNGESLEERITRLGRLPLEHTVRIIGQVAKGLQRAHASNIVHRDLKPANIFVAQTEDGEEVAKILDFGIAKMDHDDRDYKATATGVIMGTPLYMSPEQARGLRTVGTASDVYSLGMVTYCALVGDVPFHAESFGDLVYMVCTQDLPPTQELAPWLPASLDGWFRRACHKDQAQRFQTAEEMYEALIVAANVGRASGLASLPDTAQGFTLPRGLTPPNGFMMDTGGRPVPVPAGTANVRPGRAAGAHATLPFTDGGSPLGSGSVRGVNDTSGASGSGPRRAEAAMQQTLLDSVGGQGVEGHAASAHGSSGGSWAGPLQTHDGGLVATEPAPRPRSRLPLVGGAVLALSLVAGGLWWGRSTPEPVETPHVGGPANLGAGGVVAPANVGPAAADLKGSTLGSTTAAGADEKLTATDAKTGEAPPSTADGVPSGASSDRAEGERPPVAAKGKGKGGKRPPPPVKDTSGTGSTGKSLTGKKPVDLGF